MVPPLCSDREPESDNRGDRQLLITSHTVVYMFRRERRQAMTWAMYAPPLHETEDNAFLDDSGLEEERLQESARARIAARLQAEGWQPWSEWVPHLVKTVC